MTSSAASLADISAVIKHRATPQFCISMIVFVAAASVVGRSRQSLPFPVGLDFFGLKILTSNQKYFKQKGARIHMQTTFALRECTFFVSKMLSPAMKMVRNGNKYCSCTLVVEDCGRRSASSLCVLRTMNHIFAFFRSGTIELTNCTTQHCVVCLLNLFLFACLCSSYFSRTSHEPYVAGRKPGGFVRMSSYFHGVAFYLFWKLDLFRSAKG